MNRLAARLDQCDPLKDVIRWHSGMPVTQRNEFDNSYAADNALGRPRLFVSVRTPSYSWPLMRWPVEDLQHCDPPVIGWEFDTDMKW